MKRLVISLLVVALCAAAFPYIFAQAQVQSPQPPIPTRLRPDKDLAQVVRKHEQVRLSAPDVAQKVRLTGRLSLKSAERTFELDLQPNDMRARRYRTEETGADGIRREIASAPVRTYRGTVQGEGDTEARFTIDEATVEGMIMTPEEVYYVEPLSRYAAGADATEFIFYKKSDVIKDPTEMCGVTMDEVIGDAVQGLVPQIEESLAMDAATVAGMQREAEIATEADYEYVIAAGGSVAADAEILSIMNQVDGVYERELGVSFKVVYQHTWAAKGTGYPYTSTAVGKEVLQQFTYHWNTNFTVQRDLAHMWTGKDIVSETNNAGLIGIAWTGVICRNPGLSYGVSQRIGGVAEKYVLTAHEIGHNFGGQHSETQLGCDDTVMDAFISAALTFCPYSRSEIRAFTDLNSSCLATVCKYTISPLSKSFTSSGGTGSVTVTTGNTCAWTATTNASWITIISGGSGPGNKTVSYRLAANTGMTARTGTLTIGDKTHTISQSAPPLLTSLTVIPSTVIGGRVSNGNVTLDTPAPASGVTITLSDNSPAINMPTSVIVPAGLKSQKFQITTSAVALSQSGTITAQLGAISKTASLVLQPLALTSFKLSQSTVAGGNSVTGTLTVNGPAPSAGAIIALADNIASATTPATVTIPAGAESGTFTINTTAVPALQRGSITATFGGASKSAALTVRPVGVLSVSVNPNPVAAGNSATGTVVLERVAPFDVTVTLTDNLAATTIPVSVIVPAGATSKTFTIVTKVVNAPQSGTLTASGNGTSQGITLAVNPAATSSCVERNFIMAPRLPLALLDVVADDFNEDGRADLAAPYGTGGIGIFLGNGAGGFNAPINTSAHGYRPVIADFNLDGNRDLAVAGGDYIVVLAGDGTGHFSQASRFIGGSEVRVRAVGDLNRDGKPDLVLQNSSSGRNFKLAIVLGDGAGGFGPPAYILMPSPVFGVAVEDFNGDGKQDLAVAAHDGSSAWGDNKIHIVKIMMGDGTGGFGAPTDYAMGANSRPNDVITGDFNRDGKPDLAVSLWYAGRVAIMSGDGRGGFSAPTNFVVGQGAERVVMSDLNADNKADLVVPNSRTHKVSVLFGNGLGGFVPIKTYAMGVTTWEPNTVAVGDFNGDAKPDIAVPIVNNLAIMVNTCK